MIRRISLLLAAILVFQTARAEDSSCKTSSDLVEACVTVHGRLRLHANLRPYLWPVGTKTLLGISDRSGHIIMPPDIEAILSKSSDKDIFADFDICPFTPKVEGQMQLVCIAAASNVSVRSRK